MLLWIYTRWTYLVASKPYIPPLNQPILVSTLQKARSTLRCNLVKSKNGYMQRETLYWLVLIVLALYGGDSDNSASKAAIISRTRAKDSFRAALIPCARVVVSSDKKATDLRQSSNHLFFKSSWTHAWNQGIFARKVRRWPSTLRGCESHIFPSPKSMLSFERNMQSSRSTLITFPPEISHFRFHTINTLPLNQNLCLMSTRSAWPLIPSFNWGRCQWDHYIWSIC